MIILVFLGAVFIFFVVLAAVMLALEDKEEDGQL